MVPFESGGWPKGMRKGTLLSSGLGGSVIPAGDCCLQLSEAGNTEKGSEGGLQVITRTCSSWSL